MKYENEITPDDYVLRYGKPTKGKREFAVELCDGTTVYADWFQPYGREEVKVGWIHGEWMRFHISRLDGIRALLCQSL